MQSHGYWPVIGSAECIWLRLATTNRGSTNETPFCLFYEASLFSRKPDKSTQSYHTVPRWISARNGPNTWLNIICIHSVFNLSKWVGSTIFKYYIYSFNQLHFACTVYSLVYELLHSSSRSKIKQDYKSNSVVLESFWYLQRSHVQLLLPFLLTLLWSSDALQHSPPSGALYQGLHFCTGQSRFHQHLLLTDINTNRVHACKHTKTIIRQTDGE